MAGERVLQRVEGRCWPKESERRAVATSLVADRAELPILGGETWSGLIVETMCLCLHSEG